MTNEELDRLLSDEPEIVPGSGFVQAVMAAIEEAPDVPPLAFPWRRAVPGIAAGALAVLALPAIWLLQPAPLPGAADANLQQAAADLVAGTWVSGSLAWGLVAAGSALIAIVLPRRLFGSSAW